MPQATCAECGEEWTQRPPNICPHCGHNVGADNAIVSNPRLAARRRIERDYAYTRIGETPPVDPDSTDLVI